MKVPSSFFSADNGLHVRHSFQDWIKHCDKKLRNTVRHPKLATLYTFRNEQWLWSREGRLHVYLLRTNCRLGAPNDVKDAMYPHLDKAPPEWCLETLRDVPGYIQMLIARQKVKTTTFLFTRISSATVASLTNQQVFHLKFNCVTSTRHRKPQLIKKVQEDRERPTRV